MTKQEQNQIKKLAADLEAVRQIAPQNRTYKNGVVQQNMQGMLLDIIRDLKALASDDAKS